MVLELRYWHLRGLEFSQLSDAVGGETIRQELAEVGGRKVGGGSVLHANMAFIALQESRRAVLKKKKKKKRERDIMCGMHSGIECSIILTIA